jgi:hypothetical protein
VPLVQLSGALGSEILGRRQAATSS